MSPGNPDNVTIAIFAKAPIPGYAKTRLVPALGEEAAAALQGRFTERTLATASACGLGPVSLWCAPDISHPFFQACRETYGVNLHDQVGGDLGARMLRAFEAADPRPLILIGTDCPTLAAGHLRVCAERLVAGEDAVFLPAEDGGYVLVGLRRARPQLFSGIPWGTSGVMARTRDRLRAAGLRWSEPATLWDVDDARDLARLGSLPMTAGGSVLHDGCAKPSPVV